jgi:hypothetical protein
MAMVSDWAEEAGLALGFAFALVNLAWALEQVVGSGFGGVMAKGTTDLVPLVAVSLVCLATLLSLRGRRLREAPYKAHGPPIPRPVSGDGRR